MKHWKLYEARLASGKTAEEICEAVGCTRPTLYRVENGEVIPKRELARSLFRFYRRRRIHVPLAHIYDPEFAGEIRAA